MRPLIGITTGIIRTESEHEAYPKLGRQYSDAIENAGGKALLVCSVKGIHRIIPKLDALLIPGGADIDPAYYNEHVRYDVKLVEMEQSDFELKVFSDFVKMRKPVLGICYGMQLINVAFGGSLYQDIGSQLAHAVNHKTGTHKIRVEENPFIEKNEYEVNTSHHQAVKSLGKALQTIAFSQDKIIEAFFMPDYPFLMGVQWHPERMKDTLAQKIFRAFIGEAYENK